jgi:hypothetical protein
MKSKFLAIVVLLCSLTSPNAAPVSWPGQVVDARTGAAVPGIKCYGGAPGRVDLTPLAVSDADGNYVVTYEDALDLMSWKSYALDADDPQRPQRYYNYRRFQVSPAPLLVRLVPKLAFIQGVVRDAVTGQPLADVPVSLGQPGLIIKTVSTAPDGSYSFNQPAYDGQTNEETIPEGERAESNNNPTVPITNYWLRINLAGYRSMDTAARGLSLTLQSSITDAIHTRVDFALAPDGADPGVEDAMVNLVKPSGPIVPILEIGEAVELKWQSQVGVNYQVQHSPDMNSWFDDGAPIAGTDSELSALRSKDSERKYYRVALLAP